MNKNEFLEGLKEAMEFESDLFEETHIKEMEEWDSINAMVLIAFLTSKFGIKLTKEDIESISTVKSIMEKIGYDKFN